MSSFKGEDNTNSKYIEFELEEDLFLFKSCYIEGDTAYLNYLSNGCIEIDCRTGSYSELNYAEHTKSVKVYRGTVQHGFVNAIVVFYQLVSGRNWFSSTKNVLNTFPHQANNEFKRFNVRMKMSERSLTFTHNGLSVSLEEVAHILLREPQEQKTHKKLSLTEEWSITRNYMKQEISDNYGFVIPANTTNFSATTYICPECGNHISKILLPEDTVIRLRLLGDKDMKIDKAFACKHCNNFFAPFANGRLDSGIIAYLKVNSQRFNEIVQMMDDNYRLPDRY